jgi:hypothetical protein
LASCSREFQEALYRSREVCYDGDRAQEARGSRTDQGCPIANRGLGEKRKRFLVTFCRLAKSYPLLAAEAFALKATKRKVAGFPLSRE